MSASFSFEHGGDLEKAAQLVGCSPPELLDFSNLLNPSGPPPGLVEALQAAVPSAFLHPSSGGDLKAPLAENMGVDPAQVTLGAGSTEFIHFLPLMLRPKKPVIAGPTYGDYAPALRRLGLEPEWLLAREEGGWVIPPEEWEDCLKKGADWVVLARPNNPLGGCLPGAFLSDLIQGHPKTFFVVDETCREIATEPLEPFIPRPWPGNLVVLRSFSKTYAVPGLRLGFMVAAPEVARHFREFQMPWTLSPLAQSAGLFLLGQQAWLDQSRARNRLEKERVQAGLSKLRGFRAYPSTFPVFTVKGLGPDFSSPAFLGKLLVESKILIRSLDRHSGLGEPFFRIGLCSPGENDRLLSALRRAEES